MKERPMLFNPPMVRAIREGLKTQTRRVVQITHRTPGLAACLTPPVGAPRPRVASELCPHGRPGDLLYVRETVFAYGRWETRFSRKKGRDEHHFVDMTADRDRAYQYVADSPEAPPVAKDKLLPGWHKRPSLLMPRSAVRIWLEITAVRVERLLDISDADCIAEGAVGGHGAIPGYAYHATSHEHFRHIWASAGGDWESNPWVWVIEFRRVEP